MAALPRLGAFGGARVSAGPRSTPHQRGEDVHAKLHCEPNLLTGDQDRLLDMDTPLIRPTQAIIFLHHAYGALADSLSKCLLAQVHV